MDKSEFTRLVLSQIGESVNFDGNTCGTIPTEDRHILVVTSLPNDEAVRILREMASIKRFGYIVDVCIPACLIQRAATLHFNGIIHDFGEEPSENIFANTPVVFFAPDRGFCARLALGIENDFGEFAVMHALWLGLDVFADFSGVMLPFNASSKNKALSDMFLGYIEKLKSFGIKSVSQNDRVSVILRHLCNSYVKGSDLRSDEKAEMSEIHENSKVIVTRQDVLSHAENCEWFLPAEAIVTPLALDEAKKRFIRFVYS